MVNQVDAGLTKAKKMVEGVLNGFGVDADENTIEASEGGAAWQISRGSADVMIALNPGKKDASGRLRIVSPIVSFNKEFPHALALRLLELNGTELPGVAFGVMGGGMVVLVAERSVADLDKAEVEEILNLTGFYADKYDDLLVKEFGGTRVCDID